MKRICYILLAACVLTLIGTGSGCGDEAMLAEAPELRTEPEIPEPPPEAQESAEPESEAGQPESLLQNLKAGIGGRWLFRTEDHSFTMELLVEEEELRGYVTVPGDAPETIKVGVFSGDAFLFETSENGVEWLWSGQFSSDGLQGRRENLQSGAVEAFTAVRSD